MTDRAAARARLLAVPVLLLATASCGSEGPRTLTLEMRHSRFLPASIAVAAGETIRLRLVNRDPIAHEIVIGDEAEQARHEREPDRTHDGRPGEASLRPGETDEITFTFPDRPGTILYGCHRPGHYRYGMRGSISIG